MSATQTFRVPQLRALMKLVGEAREIRPSDPERPSHLISGLLRILGADVGGCVTDCDFLPGSRGAFAAVVLEGWDSTTLPALRVLEQTGSAFNPLIRALMDRCAPTPGAGIAAIRHDLVQDRSWYGSPFYEAHMGPAALDHGLVACLRLENPSVVQGLGFYRERSAAPFSDEDRNLVQLFQAECSAMLAPSLPAVEGTLRSRLSPRERQTLDLLLEGLSDKEIADRLDISPHTVNQYNKSIFRRFGVRSRTALLARLLRAEEGTPP